jgi:type I restriction enzyme M protein
VSEDLVARDARSLGRFGYFTLGATTLRQLKKSKFVRSKLAPDEERRKPDGIVFLPLGGVKAVIEVKRPAEIASKAKLGKVIKDYSPIARAVCNLLIITDGKKSYWVNPHTEEHVVGPDGAPVRVLFDAKAVDGGRLSAEEDRQLANLIEEADHSLSADNDELTPHRVIDPTGLARAVWQKIWVNTGKDPERCLYNVVEILVFKFLSDVGVLTGNTAFRRVIEILSEDGDREALTHYAQICRRRIRKLFPEGNDGTTIINGTIFVNEKGEPNVSQAVLFGQVIRSFQEFDDEAGSLLNIDREFKTRLYESFLRQQAGIKSLGQYFTPRNVVQAVVRMARVDQLKAGSSLCDPFCGVGGFVLEAIVENQNLLDQFRPDDGRVSPEIVFRGYDKGTDEKDDERTIILAKANMLVYLSDLLAESNSEEYLKEFSSHAFNDVFQLLRSNLGTFGRWVEGEEYDLILTNPPYVTSGTSSLKNAIESEDLEGRYIVGGRGTESLAIQWIVQHLKPGGDAFVIVPDGLLNQHAMLAYLKEHCFIRCIVSLPSRTFYSTPKKTYILGIERKPDVATVQSDPVFTYLVSEIGESRDTRRVPIEANDLTTMEISFRQFSADRVNFSADSDPRCKLIDWSDFDELSNWLVDRRWTRDEKVDLGVAEELYEVDEETLRDLVGEAHTALYALLEELKPEEEGEEA